MESLPLEILDHIFKYLSKVELAPIASVCKKWQELTRYTIYKTVKVKWKKLCSSKSFYVTKSLNLYREYDQNYVNFLYQVPIPWCDISPNYVDIINYCDPEKLTEFSLHDCGITDKDLKLALNRFIYLKTLCLSYCPSLGRMSWKLLQKSKTLKKLALRGTTMSDIYFRDILKNLNLFEIEMDAPNDLAESSFRWVIKETQLKVLSYHRLCTCLKSLHQIDQLINLEKLDLEGTFIYNEIFKKICRTLSKLYSINVGHCQITANGLCELKSLKRLTELNLNWNQITDDGLVHISKCTLLTHLDVGYSMTVITDEGIEQLTALQNLTHLDISINMMITDRSLLLIRSLSLLKYLNMANCICITDLGIKHLTELPLLHDLDISGCRSLTQDCMQYVREMKSLTVLHPFCQFEEFDMAWLGDRLIQICEFASEWSRWTNCPPRRTNFGKLGRLNGQPTPFDKLKVNL